ncbi:HAD family hydrolase [Nocardioides ferulae]|uniref:HAD family hydrolase n=1 Tax=Nocardioides ferulae TaxID=2340821 RepID=UPI000EAE97A3|nr:HAD family hydrolase [Nocardioides ferulae]
MSRGAVVFDLDGVLTRRDTFATLVRRRLVHHPWRLALALPALPLMALTGTRPRWRAPVTRYLVRVALLGRDPDRVRQEARALAQEFARTPTWLCPAGLDAARRHVAAGDRVVVVTATEQTLARTLLVEVGLGEVELLASGLAPAPGGSRMRPHNFGHHKVRALRECGLPRPWTVMYTDSWSDSPVLAEVERIVLVDPTSTLLARARRTWPGRVEVIGATPTSGGTAAAQ